MSTDGHRAHNPAAPETKEANRLARLVDVCLKTLDKSVDLIVSSHRLEQNSLLTFIVHKFENDPQIVSCTAGPRFLELAF